MKSESAVYRYSPEHLDPVLLTGDLDKIVSKHAEQIYSLGVFTPAFCKEIVEKLERIDRWSTEAAGASFKRRVDEMGHLPEIRRKERENCCRVFPKVKDAVSDDDGDNLTVTALDNLPGMVDVYRTVIRRHIAPLAKILWPPFDMHPCRDPGVIRYDTRISGLPTGMVRHWDQADLTLLISLNDDFEGGGTWFPRWDYCSGRPAPGRALMYPGTLSHQHVGLEITSGKRYLLACEFYDPAIGGISLSSVVNQDTIPIRFR